MPDIALTLVDTESKLSLSQEDNESQRMHK